MPLWDLTLADPGATRPRFKEPSLLRFAGDSFMDDYQKVLKRDPNRLAQHVARPETWNQESSGWTSHQQLLAEPGPIKLFQPVHNRFYLVSASLVCRVAGLPDRVIDPAAEERGEFVMRRLVSKAPGAPVDTGDPETFEEFGWFGDRQSGEWVRIPDAKDVAQGEERLPLFSTVFKHEGKTRRLLAGLIPVASREMYESGASDAASRPSAADLQQDNQAGGDLDADPRVAEFDARVIENLKQLCLSDPTASVPSVEEQASEIFLLACLDLVEFLGQHLPSVLEALHHPATMSLQGTALGVFNDLESIQIAGVSWRAYLTDIALRIDQVRRGEFDDTLIMKKSLRIANLRAGIDETHLNKLLDFVRNGLEDPHSATFAALVRQGKNEVNTWGADFEDGLSQKRFVLLLLEMSGFLKRELPTVFAAMQKQASDGLSAQERAVYEEFQHRQVGPLSWRELLVRAEERRAQILAGELGAEKIVLRFPLSAQQIRSVVMEVFRADLTNIVAAALKARSNTSRDGIAAIDSQYVIRFVYERPRCGPFERPVVSQPSRPFRLASFFDPEAPTRTVNIRLPLDTSVNGLRKFPKGANIILGSLLRQQLARVANTDPDDLLKGNLAPEPSSFNLGMICSLSIPIITICALILLMVFVQILNIVFWWLPFFKVCLPVRPEGGA